MTWIKPAVGWGLVDLYKGCPRLQQGASGEKEWLQDCKHGYNRWVRVAILPYTVARKAGLLRRPQ
jgi:hypothetical protein